MMDHEDRIAKLEAKVDALEHMLMNLIGQLIIHDDARVGATEARAEVEALGETWLQGQSTRPMALELKSLDEYLENILDSKRLSE